MPAQIIGRSIGGISQESVKGQSGVHPSGVEESQVVLREGVLGLEGGVDARRVPGGKSSINGHLSVAGFAGLLTQCRCLGDVVILAIPQNELPFLLSQGAITPGPSMRGELVVEIGWCHWFVSTEVKVGRLLGTEGWWCIANRCNLFSAGSRRREVVSA